MDIAQYTALKMSCMDLKVLIAHAGSYMALKPSRVLQRINMQFNGQEQVSKGSRLIFSDQGFDCGRRSIYTVCIYAWHCLELFLIHKFCNFDVGRGHFHYSLTKI